MLLGRALYVMNVHFCLHERNVPERSALQSVRNSEELKTTATFTLV